MRLPFSFKDLHGLPPREFCRSALRPTDRDVAKSVLPPGALQQLPQKLVPVQVRGIPVLQAPPDLKHFHRVTAPK